MTKHRDVVVLLSSTTRHGTCERWWKFKDGSEDEILYAAFKTPYPNSELRNRAIIAADASKTKAVEVSDLGVITEINWVDPFGPPFNAPASIPVIRRDELGTALRTLKKGVDVVEYNGTQYIHKYMIVSSTSSSFEFEVRNYEKTRGSSYVPALHYIVTHKAVNRGLLIEYLPSEPLHNMQLAPSEKYRIINLILDALTDLEARGYYPQDLKLPNLLLDSEKRKLHVVDLGSDLTRGMYRPESEATIIGGKIEPRDMLYAFGKTIWDLYDTEYPIELRVPMKGSLPPLIERIVVECCHEGVDPALRVVDIRDKYRQLLEATRESNE